MLFNRKNNDCYYYNHLHDLDHIITIIIMVVLMLVLFCFDGFLNVVINFIPLKIALRLPCYFQIFVWVGVGANEIEKKEALNTAIVSSHFMSSHWTKLNKFLLSCVNFSF